MWITDCFSYLCMLKVYGDALDWAVDATGLVDDLPDVTAMRPAVEQRSGGLRVVDDAGAQSEHLRSEPVSDRVAWRQLLTVEVVGRLP